MPQLTVVERVRPKRDIQGLNFNSCQANVFPFRSISSRTAAVWNLFAYGPAASRFRSVFFFRIFVTCILRGSIGRKFPFFLSFQRQLNFSLICLDLRVPTEAQLFPVFQVPAEASALVGNGMADLLTNVVHIRQSRLDSDLGFQLKVLQLLPHGMLKHLRVRKFPLF